MRISSCHRFQNIRFYFTTQFGIFKKNVLLKKGFYSWTITISSLNDLPLALNITKDIFLFADDTTITVSSPKFASSVDKFKEAFKKLEPWMQLNKSKTKRITHLSKDLKTRTNL